MPQLQFNFSLDQANLILKALDGMPYGEVHQLVQDIHEQATPQLNNSNEEPTQHSGQVETELAAETV